MDRTAKVLDLYDLYVSSLTNLLQGDPDKETVEAVRKFLKDEGVTAEVADRKDAVSEMVAVTDDLPAFAEDDPI
jgi:hypothetical protein